MRNLRKKSSEGGPFAPFFVIPSEVEEALIVPEIGNIERCLHFGRHDTALFTPLIHPIVHGFVPKLTVLRLKYPMAFIWEIQHLGGHLQHLQRREEIERLRDIKAVIVLAVYDQRRRFEIRRILMRRPFAINISFFPWRTAELPVREPQLFGRAVRRFRVKHAIVRHDAFEAVRVA